VNNPGTKIWIEFIEILGMNVLRSKADGGGEAFPVDEEKQSSTIKICCEKEISTSRFVLGWI
jgi:hypothetical protein